MKIYREIPDKPIANAVLTVGMFDGVHLGHQKVVQQLIAEARRCGGQSVLLTFWPHPRFVFEGEDCALRYLTTAAQKAELLERLGLDHLIILPFTRSFSELSPEDYIQQILVNGIGIKSIIVGYDHRFGHKGKGDFALLQHFGSQHGFAVLRIDALVQNNDALSSTKIRHALESGKVDWANQGLGYNYSIAGTVVRGKQLGRTIGYPTANLQPDDAHKLVPAFGIYITITRVNGMEYAGVTSIGVRPTVDDSLMPSIETYIFNFSADIYGESCTVFFLKRLRDEQKFDSLQALVSAIDNDVKLAKEYFAQLPLQ